MCHSAWGGSVAHVDYVVIHPSQTLMKFEELVAVLEEVAGFLFAIILVDVQVHGAWPDSLSSMDVAGASSRVRHCHTCVVFPESRCPPLW